MKELAKGGFPMNYLASGAYFKCPPGILSPLQTGSLVKLVAGVGK